MKRSANVLTLLCACMFLLSQNANAQKTDKTDKKVSANTPDVQHSKTISLSLGTTGIGVEGRMALNKHFNARLGVSVLPLNYSGPLTLDGVHTTTVINANYGKASLLAEYKPFHSSKFRLVGGLAYIFSGKSTVNLKPTSDYKIGQTNITHQELGEMDISADWSGIAPYLGCAFLKDFPKRKFNVSADLGVFYLSAPKTTWTGTELLADNQSNAAQLQDNLSGYRWFPELKVNFNYKIGK